MRSEEQREYDRTWYHQNKERLRDSKNKRIRETRDKNREYVLNYLKENPCVDCGETDPVVLDFDHKGDKHKNVSDMMRGSYGLDTIKKEIKKCDVRCANCHRRKTAKENGWFKYIGN